MVYFPKDKFLIKVDPFYHLKLFLRLWVQKESLMTLCMIILGLKLFGFITRTIFILKTINDTDVLLEVSATYPIPFLAVVKMVFLFFRRDRARFLINTVEEEFWDISVAGVKIKSQLERRFKMINLLLLNHTVTSVTYVCLHLAFPYIPIPEGRTRWLPTLIVFPLDQDKSPIHEILFIILSWNMFISAFGNGFYDFLFVFSAQHLSGQFILLKSLLRNLDYQIMEHEEDITKFNSSKFQKTIQDRIKICVKHHNLLLKYGEELKKLISYIFGLQMLLTLMTLVLLGFMLSEDLGEFMKSAMLLSFVVSSILQFVIFALQSTDIHNQSSSVAEAAYQCNWHLFRVKAKRSLRLLIMNSQDGITMYGADIVPINNEIIVEMGQKVFSCITLLKSLGDQ